MIILISLICILIGYLFGSLPSGMLIIRVATGRDIRSVGSGRTGGTNAMRAGGTLAGLATGIFDVLKGMFAIWICQRLMPDASWLETLTGLAVVIGHNYSFFLMEFIETPNGRKPVFYGGAGGAPTLGVAIAFWWPSALIIIPFGAIAFFLIGYASIATLLGGFLVFLIFTIRTVLNISSPWYMVFGAVAVVLLVWALRPNIDRLAKGTERMVGLRAWLRERGNRDQWKTNTT